MRTLNGRVRKSNVCLRCWEIGAEVEENEVEESTWEIELYEKLLGTNLVSGKEAASDRALQE
eukprot:scaffold5024_cov136-Cylindrotheca_fusiformis.AAC.5